VEFPGFLEIIAQRVTSALDTMPLSVTRRPSHLLGALPARENSRERRHLSRQCARARGARRRSPACSVGTSRGSQRGAPPTLGSVRHPSSDSNEARRRRDRHRVVSIGFVSDHLEVLYDIDVEAQAVARDVTIISFERRRSMMTNDS